MKKLFLDVETTGINEEIHAIIQLSGIIEVDNVVLKEFNFRVKPHPGAVIDKAALEVSATTLEDLQTYTPPYEVFDQFFTLLENYVNPFDKKDKFFFIAYNSTFDERFIRKFFLRHNNNYYASYFWTPSLDVMSLALEKLLEKRSQMPNFKLITVAKTLDIALDENAFHDALYDIQVTREIYQKISPTQFIEPKKAFSLTTPSSRVINDSSVQKKEEKTEFFDGLF
jgi:DNA polymerase-3 subunit epsilon